MTYFLRFCQESRSGGSGGSGKDPAADYSEGASHVLAVIHDILAHHRALESKWHAKKIKLHQRLALRLFQEDVKQVQLHFRHENAVEFSMLYKLTYSLFRALLGVGLASESRRGLPEEKRRDRKKSSEGQSLPKEPRNFRGSRTGSFVLKK